MLKIQHMVDLKKMSRSKNASLTCASFWGHSREIQWALRGIERDIEGHVPAHVYQKLPKGNSPAHSSFWISLKGLYQPILASNGGWKGREARGGRRGLVPFFFLGSLFPPEDPFFQKKGKKGVLFLDPFFWTPFFSRKRGSGGDPFLKGVGEGQGM